MTLPGGPLDEAAAPPSADVVAVEALLQTLMKGLRATQLYLPNNPVYQQAMANVRKAFEPVWEAMDELSLGVAETHLVFDGEPVLDQPSKNESFAWVLFKDGVRSLTLKHGVEEAEIAAFLSVIHRARNLPADAEDDLLTLLWEQEFEFVTYHAMDTPMEDAMPLAPSDEPLQAAQLPGGDVQHAVEEEVREEEAEATEGEEGGAPERPKGIVNLEDFDSTLYFLDENDISYLQDEVEREYKQDLRANVLAILFDLLELQTYSTVRAELISIVENFIPYLLGVGDFRSVASVLRELRVILERARELIPEQRAALEGLPARLSEPDAVAQLLQSLDEAVVHPTEEELSGLFRELRPEALETILAWLPRLSNQRVRDLLHQAVRRIATAHPEEISKALGSEDETVVIETVRLARELKLPPVVPALGGVLIRSSSGDLKVAAVEALATIGTPSAMQQLERAVEDEHRDVRVAAARTLASKGHRAALPRIEAALGGKQLKSADLTEKTAFFEAFGMLAGAAGVNTLRPLLSTGGFMKKKEDPETRACAAMALGKIGTPEARELLEGLRGDKEALVRNAASKALREGR